MQCPGQDKRTWKEDAIFETNCTKCGQVLEFFKDESNRRCRNCRTLVFNPRMDFGCASYCQFAEQCLGGLSPELMAHREEVLKEIKAVREKGCTGAEPDKTTP
jgi:hypothetical protein